MYHHYTFTTEQLSETEWAMPLLAQTLADWGFESFQEEPDKGLLNAYISDDAWHESKEISTQLATDAGVLTLYNIAWHYHHKLASSSDWLAAWRSTTFEPISLRGRMLVTTPELVPTPQTHELQLLIEAYNAFGSGEHHTTRMILEHLLDYDVKGAQVIDMGCGTGILGIAALLLGAGSLVAIDTSSECVTNTRHNLQLNGFAPSEHISVLHGDAAQLSAYPGEADLLFANIHRNIILEDLPRYVAAVRSGGEVWLSGFLLSDRTVIYQALEAVKLEVVDEATSEEWIFVRTRKG
ncbi:50S ribosomal protein L11 methyltransferase [Porphyromonas asaccharolytica]|uniref:Ribosomal L11 methyltransferase n=1 Tax=Porphyromonas asaccharolytica (strain ATCC 25260 / DSM 20707 / BCRC 10618 / CCUG 7834 / JCM 6326 / LMG 13178 / VPI 4198 / B440) TaxID=879243 RepID=F4KLE3_PORAD|nr:50S ribosomal protein L11 methyltransferase [Porphyromonas asaccharolytica]AEE13091.1 ribosomal L11 methyltransferase [Porphyromonas asaccharolytica DSM 20707]